MLKNKVITLLVLVLILVFIYFFSTKETTDKTTIPQAEIKPNLQIQPVNKVNKSLPEKLTQRQLDISDTGSQVYSEDPVVDRLIAFALFAECMNYFKPVKSIGILNVEEKKYSKIQQAHLDTHHQYCKQMKKKQPQYFDKDIYSNMIDMQNNPVKSDLSKLISNPYIDYEKIDIPKIITLIKQGHPDLMPIGYKLLGLKYKAEVLMPQMKEILGSNQSEYVESISNYGQFLYACNHGANCGKNSGFLIGLCKTNENFCLDSFEEILNTKMSQGQRNDIILAEQFFTNFYGD